MSVTANNPCTAVCSSADSMDARFPPYPSHAVCASVQDTAVEYTLKHLFPCSAPQALRVVVVVEVVVVVLVEVGVVEAVVEVVEDVVVEVLLEVVVEVVVDVVEDVAVEVLV